MVKERFIPLNIDQDKCMRCERCLRACKAHAIYFENSLRMVDYAKCKGCLNCVQVCPRNAIEVTSVMPKQTISVKIDHDKCNMCEACIAQDGIFCPHHLFYKGIVRKNGEEVEGIKYKFNEIEKCQGCLKCELSCKEEAIKVVRYNAQSN